MDAVADVDLGFGPRVAVFNNFKNSIDSRTIIIELRALGLIGKLVTGPWMKHFCASQHD